MTYLLPAGIETNCYAKPMEIVLEPVFKTVPAIAPKPSYRMPRSVTRQYSDSELSSVDIMIRKLRHRDDLSLRLARLPEPRACDSETALDIAIEKLIDKL